MNNKNIPIYLCSPTIASLVKISEEQTVANHQIGHKNGRLIICPNNIDHDTINPENLTILKEKLELKELLLIDIIKGMDGVIAIDDHVNISGDNFLRASTPLGDLPQFPDMSKIYNSLDGYKKSVVHTVGIDRFKDATHNDKIISESVGLIAPAVHYVGITVFALGLNEPKAILDII